MRVLAALSIGLAGMGTLSVADEVAFSIEVETSILAFDPFPGMKSRHRVEFVLRPRSQSSFLRQSFQTGTTDFFGFKLDSVRDNFRSERAPAVAEHIVAVEIVGETASGVGLVPNINYKLTAFYNLASGKVFKVSGCHDGYPAYKVTVTDSATPNGRTEYSYDHKSRDLLRLFGSCDVSFPK